MLHSFQTCAEEILSHMPTSWISGEELRSLVNNKKWWLQRWSVTSFYQMMFKMYCENMVGMDREGYSTYGHPLRGKLYRKK